MEWINFRHLYSFWMVVRIGNFTRAAEEMHIAQSAISAQVAALEEYLEGPLLIRTHRTLELTPLGRELLGYANSIFAQSRAINTMLKNKDIYSQHQRLRVGVVGGVSRNYIFRLLDDYLSKPNDVRVSVSTGSYEELYGLLRKFELDAIVTLELPMKKDLNELFYQKLGESEICIVGAPSTISAIRHKKTLKNLNVYKFRHPFEVELLRKYVRPLVKGELNLRLDTDDIPLLRFFANSGSGIAIIPKVGVLEDLELGRVDAIELSRCPEIFIYGITMTQAHPLLGEDGAVSLWS